MGVAVALQGPTVPLEPGAESTHELRIRNTGSVVDQFEIDVVGEASGWTQVAPAQHNLLPGEEGRVLVTFAPPRSFRLEEGPVPYAVRVMSREDTAGSVIEEGTLQIAGFSELAAELMPRTSTGRWRGHHELALDNLGNRPQLVSIVAGNPDLKLDFDIRPANPTLEPGTATFVKIVAKPKRTFYRGQNVTHAFEVSATPQEGEPIVLQGSVVQTAILPPWLLKAALVAIAAIIGFTVLWLTMLRPTIESTAKAVAEDHTEELAQAITAASSQAAAAQQQAAAAQEAATGGGGDGKGGAKPGSENGGTKNAGDGTGDGDADTGTNGSGKGGSGTDTGTPVGGTLSPKDAVGFRVTTDVPPAGGFVSSRHVPAEKTTLWISDLVLQNPAGDTGTLRIQRGDDVLLVFGLENFRDLDYHFLQAVAFTPDEPIVVDVDCKNPNGNCTPSVYFAGQTVADPKKPKKPEDG